MKIAPQGAAAVNGHDAHKYEIHFGEHMARAVVGRQFCQCGCERSAWILALEFPEGLTIDPRVVSRIHRRLLPHVPMKQVGKADPGSRYVRLAENRFANSITEL